MSWWIYLIIWLIGGFLATQYLVKYIDKKPMYYIMGILFAPITVLGALYKFFIWEQV